MSGKLTHVDNAGGHPGATAATAGAAAPAPATLGPRVVAWFARVQRDLPWRGPFPRDPYRVLVAETMLQQTQVARVVPAYERFLARFPDVTALAAAPEEAVLAAFAGLGYYRRARLLRQAAQAVARAGAWPREPAALRALPGLGAYTAAALAAFAFAGTEPPVDGNVGRVAARCGAHDLAAGSGALLRAGRDLAVALHRAAPTPALFEALMELGATVCLPEAPRCAACPLQAGCAAAAAGTAARYPRPRATRAPEAHTWVALWLTRADGAVLLRRVTDGPVLQGIWLPPFASVADEAPPRAAARLARALGHRGELAPRAPVRHSITHRRITVHPFAGAAASPGAAAAPAPPDEIGWFNPRAPQLATSSLLGKLRRACAGAAGRARER